MGSSVSPPLNSGIGARLWFGFLLVIIPAIILPQSPPDTADNLPSPRGALIRSVIIPGWGQAYTGHYLKAAGFLGTHAFFAYKFYDVHQQLDTISDVTERNKTEYRRNTWAWRYLAAYLLCITDAYVDAHLAGFPEDDTDLSLGFTPTDIGWQMNIGITF